MIKSAIIPILFLSSSALACPQTKPVHIDKKLVQELGKISLSSANAYEVEQKIGPACACLPMGKQRESWICQWKGDLSSNRLENTLNISFSAGTLMQILAIDGKGEFIR